MQCIDYQDQKVLPVKANEDEGNLKPKIHQTFYKNSTDVDFFKAIKPLPGAFPSSVN